MIEEELERLNQQLFKLDQARQMRDSSSAIIAVGAVLQKTVQTTKATMDGQKVLDVLDEYRETLDDMKDVHSAFASAAAASDVVADADLQQELAELMAQETSNFEEMLPSPPRHDLPLAEDLITPSPPLSAAATSQPQSKRGPPLEESAVNSFI